jgi:hypothetical protein
MTPNTGDEGRARMIGQKFRYPKTRREIRFVDAYLMFDLT